MKNINIESLITEYEQKTAKSFLVNIVFNHILRAAEFNTFCKKLRERFGVLTFTSNCYTADTISSDDVPLLWQQLRYDCICIESNKSTIAFEQDCITEPAQMRIEFGQITWYQGIEVLKQIYCSFIESVDPSMRSVRITLEHKHSWVSSQALTEKNPLIFIPAWHEIPMDVENKYAWMSVCKSENFASNDRNCDILIKTDFYRKRGSTSNQPEYEIEVTAIFDILSKLKQWSLATVFTKLDQASDCYTEYLQSKCDSLTLSGA